MGKPWAKLEIGYLDHPKFLALNANAICLWHEGKNYCEKFHTDGLIPRDALQLFRFRGSKAIELLTTPCATPKPDGSRYAALWEVHPVGFKMHDYLDHNDCRDEVMSRLEDAEDAAELRRLGNRDRQRKARADRKAKIAALKDGVTDLSRIPERDVPRDRRGPTETVTLTLTSTPPSGGVAPARMAPLHTTHKKHAHCGRICMHAGLFDEFVRRRNHDGADREIRDWASAVDLEWQEGGPYAHLEPGDSFDFWKARYAERWPAAPTKPAAVLAVPDAASTRERYLS